VDPAEALAQAIQDEALDLGCGADELSMRLSEVLSLIVLRYKRAMDQDS
jgi:hypothetical protein